MKAYLVVIMLLLVFVNFYQLEARVVKESKTITFGQVTEEAKLPIGEKRCYLCPGGPCCPPGVGFCCELV
uniref:Uncharacterized protein n=1 Tax=Panagrolaimus sp. JU765 TaxID=591449 RepID=A0AC34R5U7_9BILA